MNRVLKVARMQFVNKYTFVWMPLIILSISFAMSLVIFALIPYDGAKYGGGSQAPIWYFFALGIMALSYTFPFSQAMSITRRDFFFGTLLAALFTSIMLGIVFVLGLFALLVGRGMVLGLRGVEVGQRFAGYVAFGISLMIGLQALVSVGVNLGVLPTKGLTLPLNSSGGSSVMMTCAAIGLLVRVSYEVSRADNAMMALVAQRQLAGVRA